MFQENRDKNTEQQSTKEKREDTNAAILVDQHQL